MNFICRDIEEEGKAEVTTMQTLLQWSGKKESEIMELYRGSKDGFIIDGYLFKKYVSPEERKAIKERERYLKAVQRQNDREKSYITNGIEWEDGEKPPKVLYELDGVVTKGKEVVKALKTNSTTLVKLMRQYKQFDRNGKTLKAVSIARNRKVMHLYKDGKHVLSGTAEDIAKKLNRTTYSAYKMCLDKRIVNGFEVKESVDK